ncbi:MAG: YggS family pyridoxal phosphate-dependent enzyme [Planctomycetota bacterium]
MSSVAERLRGIRKAIEHARSRSAEPDREVTIVAVTKGRPAELVEEVAAAGVLDIGENRVPEALAKAPQVRAPVRWHMIGHLQRNKAAKAVGLFTHIHSVDSERLIHTLAASQKPVGVFLQVNVSGEAAKDGVRPESARSLSRTALQAPSLRPLGLMTMAPLVEDPEEVRGVFRALRELREDLNRTGDGPPLCSLSMGMSNDYTVAVEEGATHVRIGTALTGPIAPRGG